MPPRDTSDPITGTAIRNWWQIGAGIIVVAVTAGGLYQNVKSELSALHDRVQALEVLPAQVQAATAQLADVARQRTEESRQLARVLSGLESIDHKLFALVCTADHSKCGEYISSVPPP